MKGQRDGGEKKNEEEKGIRRWNAKWSPAAEIMQYILPKPFRETR